MTSERKEHTFKWFVENYSYCSYKIGECFTSPEFITDDLECTIWSIWLYPRGESNEAEGHISLFLNRRVRNKAPENFSLNFELSIVAADGSPHYLKNGTHSFKAGEANGWIKFLPVQDVLWKQKMKYLPGDTLTILCKLWKGEGNILKVSQTCARSRMKLEKISYTHAVQHFSSLEPNEKKTIKMGYGIREGDFISSNLYISDGACCERKLLFEIGRWIPLTLFKCKLSLLGASGNAVECGEVDYRYDSMIKDIRKFPLTLTRGEIMDSKSEYLPGDELTLLCECIFSVGEECGRIEERRLEIPLKAMKQVDNHARSVNTDRLEACPGMVDDLNAIYSQQCLTDVELKTKTKSFPAHKVVLAARSPVFKAMLTNDMKEKINDCIHVDDLGDDTVQLLLSFLYSDELFILQRKIATDLYYAADKYQIEKLKRMCSSYLVDNLCSSTASELLLLADTHNDSDLKKVVEDFILEHEEQVFGSDEWEKLIEVNPQLVIKTMHLKYKRKK